MAGAVALMQELGERQQTRKVNQGTHFHVLYDQVCNKIRSSNTTDTIMVEFQNCTTDLDRIHYASQRPELSRLELNKNLSSKSSEDANSFEAVYNIIITNESSATKALEVIRRSIYKTPSEEKSALAIRYMKRGWVFMLLKEFDSAFLDAKRSQTFHVPENLLWNSFEIMGYYYAKKMEYKPAEKHFLKAIEYLRSSDLTNEIKAVVIGRIMPVLKNVKDNKNKKTKDKHVKVDIIEQPKLPLLSYGRKKGMETVSSAIDFVIMEDKGRAAIANRNIKTGDVLMVDHAYASILNADQYTSHCYQCFTWCIALVPCSHCTMVGYCSEECRDLSWSNSHELECPVLEYLSDDQSLGKMGLLVFRTLGTVTWSTLKEQKKRIEEKIANEKDEKMSISSMFEGNIREPWLWDGVYSYKDYMTVLNQVTNDTKRTFGDLFKRTLAGIYIGRCLAIVGYFGDDSTSEDLEFVCSLALRHLQSSSCNAYEIFEFETGSDGDVSSEELGGAIYSSISLTNHSCFSNCARYNIGSSCVLRAMRSIPKGTEILDNYGYSFQLLAMVERVDVLRNQYKFECSCEACIGKWKKYPHRYGEALYFKCPMPNCNESVSYDPVEMFSECPLCGNKPQFSKLVKEIDRQMTIYKQAKINMQSGKEKQSLTLFIEHQEFLDKHAVLPGSHYTDTQEAIKQLYYCLGNLYIHSDKDLASDNQQDRTVYLKKREKRKRFYW